MDGDGNEYTNLLHLVLNVDPRDNRTKGISIIVGIITSMTGISTSAIGIK